MHHSAAQLQPAQQTTLSLRASQYKPTSKRKRGQRDELVQEPAIVSASNEAAGALPSSNAQSHLSLDGLETPQLRVAGLLPEDEFDIPPHPFPHAPARTSKDAFNSTKLQEELANLDPPLYAVKAASKSDPIDRMSKRPALRQTHLGVLSTMMHRCLLQGDYQRAGRAWGMILRTQIGGLPIDPRNHGRWGIGAEILLRRNAHARENLSSNLDKINVIDGEQHIANEDFLYSQEGFELAREYYERLIVQHPNRKHLPHSVDDRTFYPAMFALWIYEVSERSKRERHGLEWDKHNSTSESASFDEDTTMAMEDARAAASVIRKEEVHQARQIAQRMDQLVMSPPFDKHAGLLQLRGMVGLWISDVVLGKESSEQGEDNWTMELKEHDENISYESAAENLSYVESLRELKEAQVFFDRAQTNGQRLGDTITSVDAKIKDLTKRMEKLGK
jgi:hypothetical protein